MRSECYFIGWFFSFPKTHWARAGDKRHEWNTRGLGQGWGGDLSWGVSTGTGDDLDFDLYRFLPSLQRRMYSEKTRYVNLSESSEPWRRGSLDPYRFFSRAQEKTLLTLIKFWPAHFFVFSLRLIQRLMVRQELVVIIRLSTKYECKISLKCLKIGDAVVDLM